MDLTDTSSITNLIKKFKPDEFYNLASGFLGEPLENERFLHQERLNRSPLASATPNNLALRHGNWTFERTEDSQGECFKLKGTILSEAAFEFDLRPSKPITLFGDQGYSRKGEGPNAASYYMTFTRTKTSGTLQFAEGNRCSHT